MVFSVPVLNDGPVWLFESMCDMGVSDFIDKISQEACKCTHRAYLPVWDTFLRSRQILHTQKALIMGSITQRTETIKICNQLNKKTRKM